VDAAFDGLIVDLDGVVWIGTEPVPGSADAVAALREHGLPLVFLTNDPTGSRAEYVARLAAVGISASEEEIVTSGSALAMFMRDEGAARIVYAIGSPSLKAELEAIGLELRADGRDVDAVAVGGHRDFDYDELRIATQAVRRGARLYAAGRDATFPMPDGPWPATGAIVAAVETAAGVQARSVGKPEPYIFEIARSLLRGCDRVAIVGDNLESDIAGGKRAGLATILVLTGTTSRDDLAGAEVEPDLVLADLAALVA
jgi:glycerol-1-phosphatase